MISTRGRYALRVMIDLAEHKDEGFIPMKDVVARQEISKKYMEQIMPSLVKSGFVEGVHGKGGGYKLTREPSEYTAGEILRAAEGDLAPVACLSCDAQECPRKSQCKTLPMWEKYNDLINGFFDSYTLESLLG
ncbi:MAG: RrF2 family transcriptional regulator [Acutalibacteraceae bacterium]|nr:RrF2 family transcriptional regulator [Acutalibacteraceae bacterium]